MLIFVATLATIVSVDLLVGVLVGVALSVVKMLYRFSRLKVDLHVSDDQRQATVTLLGAATFLRLPMLAKQLERAPAAANVHVDLHGLLHIDFACLELFWDWSKQHEATGGQVALDWKRS